MKFKSTIANVHTHCKHTNSIIFGRTEVLSVGLLFPLWSFKSRVEYSDSTPANHPDKTSTKSDFFNNIKSFSVSVPFNFNEKLLLQLCAILWDMCEKNIGLIYFRLPRFELRWLFQASTKIIINFRSSHCKYFIERLENI